MIKTKLKLILIFLVSLSLRLASQDKNDLYADQLIKIYSASWNTKYLIPRGIKNIKELHSYFFQTDGSNLNLMFLDYEDCKTKLSEQKLLPDSLQAKIINSLVEFYFDKEHYVSIYFDNRGNYYFNEKWHVKSNELYYLLFKYFSNEIVPQKTLEEAKLDYKDNFWHEQ